MDVETGTICGIIGSFLATSEKGRGPNLRQTMFDIFRYSCAPKGCARNLRPLPGAIQFPPDGTAIGAPTATGLPKSGVPSGLHVNSCARGERRMPHPCPDSELAW